MGSLLDNLERLQQSTRGVFARHGVVLAYLYGSQARGEAGPLSDVDVAVGFAPHVPPDERFRRTLELSAELGALLQRHDVSVVDVAVAPPLLRHRIYLDGRLLHCPDQREHIRFATRAVRDYVDTEPLRRIKRHYVLRRFEEGG